MQKTGTMLMVDQAHDSELAALLAQVREEHPVQVEPEARRLMARLLIDSAI